jgi:ribosomal protein L9
MKKKVTVVLKERVEMLGERGEMKSVALGFFKNYLLPRGLVVPAGTKEAQGLVEQKQRETREPVEAEEPATISRAKSKKKPAKVKKK